MCPFPNNSLAVQSWSRMCFCKASQNNNEVKLYFRQEDLLSKLLRVGLVFQLEKQIMMNRKKLLFYFM